MANAPHTESMTSARVTSRSRALNITAPAWLVVEWMRECVRRAVAWYVRDESRVSARIVNDDSALVALRTPFKCDRERSPVRCPLVYFPPCLTDRYGLTSHCTVPRRLTSAQALGHARAAVSLVPSADCRLREQHSELLRANKTRA